MNKPYLIDLGKGNCNICKVQMEDKYMTDANKKVKNYTVEREFLAKYDMKELLRRIIRTHIESDLKTEKTS